VAAGVVAEHFSGASVTLPKSVSTVVASIAPTTSGTYLVDATAAGDKPAGGYLVCRAIGHSAFFGSLFSPTPYGFNNTASTIGTMAETGAMFGGIFEAIQERCSTDNAGGATVIDAAITGTLVNTLNGAAAPNHLAKKDRRPANKFVIPKAMQGGKQTPRGLSSKG
jgi:hypothetical protein